MTAPQPTLNQAAIAQRWFHAIPTDPWQIADELRRQQVRGSIGHPLDNPLSIWCYLETQVWPIIGDRHFAVEVDGELLERPTPFHVMVFLILFDLGRFPDLIGFITNGDTAT